jgi:uncharacterized protein YjbI with pentapeptide repeats
MFERRDYDFTDQDLRHVVVRGADVRGGGFADCRLRGVELENVDLYGELNNVFVNGVEIWPLVDAELNRRDPEARPGLDEVMAVRAERQAMVRAVLDGLTEEQLASTVTMTEPGWPQLEKFPLNQCLRIVLNEEWEHRSYAERDLAALETA